MHVVLVPETILVVVFVRVTNVVGSGLLEGTTGDTGMDTPTLMYDERGTDPVGTLDGIDTEPGRDIPEGIDETGTGMTDTVELTMIVTEVVLNPVGALVTTGLTGVTDGLLLLEPVPIGTECDGKVGYEADELLAPVPTIELLELAKVGPTGVLPLPVPIIELPRPVPEGIAYHGKIGYGAEELPTPVPRMELLPLVPVGLTGVLPVPEGTEEEWDGNVGYGADELPTPVPKIELLPLVPIGPTGVLPVPEGTEEWDGNVGYGADKLPTPVPRIELLGLVLIGETGVLPVPRAELLGVLEIPCWIG